MLIVPPGSGIVHQVNLEYLARVVFEGDAGDNSKILYPDSVVGTDSHTTMINGLGVLGWGVGGKLTKNKKQKMEIMYISIQKHMFFF